MIDTEISWSCARGGKPDVDWAVVAFLLSLRTEFLRWSIPPANADVADCEAPKVVVELPPGCRAGDFAVKIDGSPLNCRGVGFVALTRLLLLFLSTVGLTLGAIPSRSRPGSLGRSLNVKGTDFICAAIRVCGRGGSCVSDRHPF